jgi:hypothetical protein
MKDKIKKFSDFINVESGLDAYDNYRERKARDYRYPNKNDTRYRYEMLWPNLRPRFKIKKGSNVFTVGSCFARNIETVLNKKSVVMPVLGFKAPKDEMPSGPPSHLLNEYTLSTMHQRILSIIGQFEYGTQDGVYNKNQEYYDLYLYRKSTPVSYKRLIERRKQIDELYQQLKSSDLVILTLGLIESWYDCEMDVYLNSAPSKFFISESPKRFQFVRLNYAFCLRKLDEIVNIIKDLGIKNILLTVSPVPIEISFTKDDVIIANNFSKSVLRNFCEEIYSKYSFVNYFPSYEIISSGGVHSMMDDNIHPKKEVIDRVISYMAENYVL